ncbi:MAG: molybdopterin-dependent oxidoreductase [Desulfobacteraceae bacterium]|jgi:sulfoxide reductase catalytic subunit YedY
MMETRRNFIKGILGCLGFVGLLLSPFSRLVRSGLAEAKKIILPKETKRESLVSRNPANLDTRNLGITPLQDFGTMGLSSHEVDLGGWRLEVNGHVKNPLRLTYKEITSLPSIEREVLQICPGFFANHGRWKGISMGELLKTAKVEDGITHVTLKGPRGSYENLQRFPIEDILSNKVFLAYQVNGHILPQKHGFPLRTVAEGYYGYDWVKYVDQITVEKI